MKSYNLKPTIDNIVSTYKKDSIGRNSDVFRFIEILNSIDDGVSIALEGNWGSGKTFFVKQVKMVMDAHNDFVEQNSYDKEEIRNICNQHYRDKILNIEPQVCVYYDAWENDNDDDPVMSLVYTIMNSVNTNFSFKNRDFIKTGAGIMQMFTGMDWLSIINGLKGTSPLDTLKERKDIEKEVGKFLDELLLEKGERLVIFIDELDRCKPSYAVRLLERIKHYFIHEKITFVFSVNINELQHTVKKHYGNDFDGARYLERFFDLRVSLPSPNLSKYFQSLNFNEYSSFVFDAICLEVIKRYRFELREIAKFLPLVSGIVYKVMHGEVSFWSNDGRAIAFCIYYVIPVMIGLRLQNSQRYTGFIEGKDYSPLMEIADQINYFGCKDLLNDNETFDKCDTNKTYVTLEEKIKAVYEAVFATVYTDFKHNTIIGTMAFNRGTKDEVLRISGLLSRYARYDVD